MATATLSASAPAGRVVNRGANPFAAIIRQQNNNLTPRTTSQIYESVQVRGDRVFSDTSIQTAVQNARQRLGIQKYSQKHFGEVLTIKFGLMDININIQRDEDIEHIAKDIIDRFDPRIAMPVMCTKLKNGRYSAWEGQQTTLALYVLWKAGLIDEDFEVQIKAVDEDLDVPGSTLKGEAVGNLGFRVINGGGRKPVDAYTLHRSRVNGVRLYNSQFTEDIQSEQIQRTLEANNMFPAPAKDARGQGATPGMVTYIHGLNSIAGHGKDMKTFVQSIKDLEWTLQWHDKYFSNEKGVDGGFILGFGRLAAQAREQNIELGQTVQDALNQHVRATYGSPKGFHSECKNRLERFNLRNGLKNSWSDSCLTPILVSDYIDAGGKENLPVVNHMSTYAGI